MPEQIPKKIAFVIFTIGDHTTEGEGTNQATTKFEIDDQNLVAKIPQMSAFFSSLRLRAFTLMIPAGQIAVSRYHIGAVIFPLIER